MSAQRRKPWVNVDTHKIHSPVRATDPIAIARRPICRLFRARIHCDRGKPRAYAAGLASAAPLGLNPTHAVLDAVSIASIFDAYPAIVDAAFVPLIMRRALV